MKASEIEVAWLAGLLEGEGSFLVVARKSSGLARPRISMTTTDRDVLDRVVALMGGSVSEVDRPNKKLAWSWCCSAFADVEYWLNRLHPYMGRRRQEQIDAVLAARPWGANSARSALRLQEWKSGKRANRRRAA